MAIPKFSVELMQYGFNHSSLCRRIFFFPLAQTAPGLRTLIGREG